MINTHGGETVNQEQLLTKLAVELRRQGVAFEARDVKSFVAKSGRLLAIDQDIESLVNRFKQTQGASGRAIRRRHRRALWGGMCLIGIGCVILVFCTLFFIGSMDPVFSRGPGIWITATFDSCAFAVGTVLVGVGIAIASGIFRR